MVMTEIRDEAEYVAELVRCAALGDSQVAITAAITAHIVQAQRRADAWKRQATSARNGLVLERARADAAELRNQRIRALCQDSQALATNGKWCDVGTLWPREVLAALDGTSRFGGERAPK